MKLSYRFALFPGLDKLLRLSRIAWPVLAGLGAALAGVLILTVSWYFESRANHLRAESTAVRSQLAPSQGTTKPLPPSIHPTYPPPDQGVYLQDLARLFKLAKDAGISIGGVEYRAESSTVLPIQIRTLEVRVNDEYPKLKKFVAVLLEVMPHVSLQEIRIERKEASMAQAQIMLKLSFVYQSAVNAPREPSGRARQNPFGNQRTPP